MKGIYCIVIEKCIVYVGRSKNIQKRVAEHWYNIYHPAENKYYLLNDAVQRHAIHFFHLDDIEDNESIWIQLIQPCLNSKLNNNNGIELTAAEFYDNIYNSYHLVEFIKEVK